MLDNFRRVVLRITMKRRKREHLIYHNKNLFTAVLHLIVCRRQHHLFSLFSAVSACLLLAFASFSILSLPPATTTPLIRLNSYANIANIGGGAGAESNSIADTLFKVPDTRGNLGHDLWSSSRSKFFHGCSNATDKFKTADTKTHSNRYLVIATSGGLNQQRTGITDSVVAAYILNATLVVPKLDQKSYWKDDSVFADIFDVDWFISTLTKDVKIIKELPLKDGKVWIPVHTRVPRKCSPKCYETRILPILDKKHAVQLSKFDYRLSNKLDIDLQRLRCRVNYHALRFSDPILEMGKILVARMKKKAKHFIALHLRFESDMLAFTGCYYGGGEKERTELGAMRKRWKTLHRSNPDKMRRHGRCPLTPEEISLMLRALGFGSEVHMYVASGEIYGGEETLSPLKELFPNFHSKETIATKEELETFSSFSSRMAALDYIVCDESDVFVTNNNGNMAKMLAGRRRYFGHRPTIRPNGKKLYKLFMNRTNLTWEEFSSKVRASQIGFMGKPNELKPGWGEFHENPSSCICEISSEGKAGGISTSEEESVSDGDKTDQENDKSITSLNEQSIDEEQDLGDMEDLEGELREVSDGSNTGSRSRPEQQELVEEPLSE